MLNVSAAQNVVPAGKASPWVQKGVMFYASLNKTVQARKAKMGDPVDFKVVEATLFHGTVVPANATLHGRVTEIHVASNETLQDSLLGILVDSITWKKNSLPVCASIVGFGEREFRFTGPPPSNSNDARALTIETPVARRDGPSSRNAFSDVGQNPFDVMFATQSPRDVAETNVIVAGSQYAKDLMIHRSAASGLVLSKHDKDLKLPGGMLVAIGELPDDETVCSTTGLR